MASGALFVGDQNLPTAPKRMVARPLTGTSSLRMRTNPLSTNTSISGFGAPTGTFRPRPSNFGTSRNVINGPRVLTSFAVVSRHAGHTSSMGRSMTLLCSSENGACGSAVLKSRSFNSPVEGADESPGAGASPSSSSARRSG